MPILDIDCEGMLEIVKNIENLRKKKEVLQVPIILCVLPPSLRVLEERLKGRNT